MATDVRPEEQGGASGGAASPASTTAASVRTPTSRSRLRRLGARILDRYPELPPAPTGTLAGVCLGVVALLALAFAVYFTAYMWARHDAYQTFGEDLGIMDQAIWNVLHGAPLHQTICNSLTDTNCLGDVSRLAIHFEPILFPISLLYIVAPSPKTLLLLQSLVVASGAFPAYWLASRRLRSALAGVAFAAIFLLYPALQAAVTYDFHAVTLSAAFLMFALYFMLARNDKGLIIACLLAMSTKEEVPLAVLLIGLSVAFLQGRRRLGLTLAVLALAWIAVELPIMHFASPLGRSPVAGRYDYLPHLITQPLTLLRQHIFDPAGVSYLRGLFSPVGYLSLLSPLTLLIAAPAIGLNILSSDPSQRSGIYHYNAEIVPVLVFAAIESVALLAVTSGWLARRLAPTLARAEGWRTLRVNVNRRLAALPPKLAGVRRLSVTRVALAVFTLLALFFSLHEQDGHGYLPVARGFAWPQQTAHTRLADDIARLIPADASLSAQATLVPHVSHRRLMYQFPYMDTEADYVFLDVTAPRYPYAGDPDVYIGEVKTVLEDPAYHVVVAQDGYLLLARGVGPVLNTADPNGLPDAFYSFAEAPAATRIATPLDARFGAALELVGYDLTPTAAQVNTPFTLITYWRVSAPITEDVLPEIMLHRADGTVHPFPSFVETLLHPATTWRPGMLMTLTIPNFFLTSREQGLVRFSAAAGTPSGGVLQPLPATLLSAPGPNGVSPALLPDGTDVYFADLAVR